MAEAQPTHGHHHPHRRINLGDCENEEEILDAIEQSRKITRLIIAAVQKGSKFEVSQILEHYGLAMTSRLHFKVVNIVMEQWFSLVGIENEQLIFNLLKKNKFAMDKLKILVPKGTMAVSDQLSEWELPIGALQSKIIRRVTIYFQEKGRGADSGGVSAGKGKGKESGSAESGASGGASSKENGGSGDPPSATQASDAKESEKQANGGVAKADVDEKE